MFGNVATGADGSNEERALAYVKFVSTLPFMSEPVAEIQLGGLVRGAREAAGLTIQQLADASGTSYPTISRIELGSEHTPTPSKLAAILMALHIPMEVVEQALADDLKLLEDTKEWMRKRNGLRAYQEFVNAGTLRFIRDSRLPEDLMLISPQDVVCRVQVGGPGNTQDALRDTMSQLADIIESAGWQVRVLPEMRVPPPVQT